jgi:hypothetical protein
MERQQLQESLGELSDEERALVEEQVDQLTSVHAPTAPATAMRVGESHTAPPPSNRKAKSALDATSTYLIAGAIPRYVFSGQDRANGGAAAPSMLGSREVQLGRPVTPPRTESVGTCTGPSSSCYVEMVWLPNRA